MGVELPKVGIVRTILTGAWSAVYNYVQTKINRIPYSVNNDPRNKR